jgi:hypothetical protein
LNFGISGRCIFFYPGFDPAGLNTAISTPFICCIFGAAAFWMMIPLAIMGVALVLSKVFFVRNGVSGTSGYKFLLPMMGVAVRIDKSSSASCLGLLL